ncbi:MAG: hypothetical protein IPN09_14845 [Bacteroidetes bacterium]|nr:hypothetical protein [Bacteroidota bacterium]
MMARNLDFRVELLARLLDQNISNQVLDIMNMQWNDNQKRVLFQRINPINLENQKDDTIIRSQDDIYDYYEKFAQQHKNEI